MVKRLLLVLTVALPAALLASWSCSDDCFDTASCPCVQPADCPFFSDTDCRKPSCEHGVCLLRNEPVGTPCSENGDDVCDGNGECVTGGNGSGGSGNGGSGGGNGGSGGGNGGSGTGGAACTTCGDDCVDLASAAHHCGACGHDCIYGACEGGSCQPFTIGIASGLVKSFAVGPDHVYWHAQDSGAIARVDKLGSAQDNMWALLQENVGHIAAGPAALYWHSAGADHEIRYQPYSIGPWVTVMHDATTLTSLAVDGSATIFGALGSPVNVLFYINSSLTPVPIYTVPSPHHLAVGDTVIGCLSGTGSSTALRFGPKSPGSLDSEAAPGALGLAFDGQAFFWHTTSRISRFVPAPPAQEVVADGINPDVIAVDSSAGYVYWLDLGSGELWRTSLSQPAAPEKVADSPAQPEMLLAVDDTSIYWVSGETDILRLVKPAQ